MIDGVPAVLSALNQVVLAGSARITVLTEHSWTLPPMPARRDRGPIAAATVGLGRAVGKAAGRGLVRLARGVDLRHQTGEGLLDLAGRRSMVDYGSFAVLQAETQEWSGRSGRPLDTLPAFPPRAASPLWLIDLISGVTTAADQGTVDADAHGWRHLRVKASLAQASSRRPEGMPSPARSRYEELLELPLEVWLDDGHLKRIRFADEYRTDTMTLSDFGVDTERVDWRRLPDLTGGDEQADLP